MSLPTKSDVETLDFSYLGQPYVRVATKLGIDLNTLDYSYLGQPFWGLNEEGECYTEVIVYVNIIVDVITTTVVGMEG